MTSAPTWGRRTAMAPGNRQPKWDIYEAVILLDGYLEVLRGTQLKARIVKRISAGLRRMAVNRGIEIDDIYRNENGISYQIQSMDSAYKGEKIYVPATKLFAETVELYRRDTERYFEILEEAKNMIAAKQNSKDAFLTWAASVFPTQRCKWIEANILKMEQLAVASKLISGSIFDVTDMATIEAVNRTAEKNKIFQIKNRKHLKNINNDFKAYMQYCLQLSKLIEQADTTEAPAAETSAKPMSAVVASMEPIEAVLIVLLQHCHHFIAYLCRRSDLTITVESKGRNYFSRSLYAFGFQQFINGSTETIVLLNLILPGKQLRELYTPG